MANQFLIKNTMADMRGLSASEILSLQGTNPSYLGVQLLGYYEKGDTPAPITYFLSDSIEDDNGGSIIGVADIKLEHIFLSILYTSYFGVFQVNTSLIDSFQKASKYAGKNNLNFIIDQEIKLTSSVNLYSNLNGASRITGSSGIGFVISSNNCKVIENVNYTATKDIAQNGTPIFITTSTALERIDDLTIRNNNIKDARTRILSQGINTYFKNIKIISNVFNIDFSGYQIESVQNDVLTFYGIKNIIIVDNYFDIYSTNRVLKIQANPNNENDITEKVLITNNIFNVSADNLNGRSKQVIDMFNKTRDVIIKGNIFYVSGYLCVIEDKTATNYALNKTYIISDNIYRGDGDFISIRGTFSLFERAANSYCSILFNNNVLNRTNIQINGTSTVEFRFIDNLDCSGNNIVYNEAQTTQPYGIYLANCGSSIVSSNQVKNCQIYYTVMTLYQSLNYIPVVDAIIINNNIFYHHTNSVQQSIRVQIPSAVSNFYCELIQIDGNKGTYENSLNSYRLVRLDSVKVNKFLLTNNLSNVSTLAYIVNSMIYNTIRYGNLPDTSFNLPLQNSTNSLPGLVMQSYAVANSTLPDATDLATAIALVNDLKVRLNQKFAVDRSSGQQGE